MKKYFFIILAAAALTSCSKNKDNVNDPSDSPSTTRVKTVASLSVTDYVYDNQGRVIEINNSGGSKKTYEYSPGLVKMYVYASGGVLNYIKIMELNAKGQVSKTTYSNNPGYEVLDIYNVDGTKAKSVASSVNGSTVMDYFYTNGNLDSSRQTANSAWTVTVKKTYYTDKNNGLSNEVYGDNIYGKGSKNLLKSDSFVYPDGTVLTVEYVYEFDAQGRVSKQIATQGGTLGVSIFSYY